MNTDYGGVVPISLLCCDTVAGKKSSRARRDVPEGSESDWDLPSASDYRHVLRTTYQVRNLEAVLDNCKLDTDIIADNGAKELLCSTTRCAWLMTSSGGLEPRA